MKIIFFYERSRGGGAIAMKNIISRFKKIPGIKIVCSTTKPITNWSTFNFFDWIIRNIASSVKVAYKHKGADWIYSSTFSAAFAVTLLKSLIKFKLCYHFHVLEIPENASNFSSKMYFTQEIKILILKYLHRSFLRFTDLVIVPSNYSKLQVVKNFKIDNTKVKVIPNGVSPKFFKKSSTNNRNSLKKRIGLKNSDVVISYFGRLEKHKNIAAIIRSLSYLKSDQKYKLLVTYIKPNNSDEKNYKRYLELLSRNLDVDKNTIWLETPKKLENYYQISDIVLLPSKTENLPLVMLETFASRKLFLSTQVGGVTEVLDKVDKRLMIRNLSPKRFSTQIIKVLNLSKAEKEKITAKEFEFVRDLTWKKVSDEIYSALVSV